MGYIEASLTAISFVLVLLGVWLVPLYRKLTASEKAIRAKEDELDVVEEGINRRTAGTLTNEKQRLAQVANARKPIERELERLKQERQFIIDKLPFFKN